MSRRWCAAWNAYASFSGEDMNETRKIRHEEVDAVDKPRTARVEDAAPEKPVRVAAPSPHEAESDTAKLTRKRDYLEGFLAQKPDQATASTGTGAGSEELREAVIDTLKSIYDPEIPVNIYDLGLIYGVEVTPENHAIVTMTLTTPHCPVAESMPGEIEMQVGSVPGVGHSEVNLVWDPPWDPQKMSDEAKLELGML